MLLFKQQTALGLFFTTWIWGEEMSMQMQNSKNTVLAFFFLFLFTLQDTYKNKFISQLIKLHYFWFWFFSGQLEAAAVMSTEFLALFKLSSLFSNRNLWWALWAR
jgi:hypothetical protein